MHEPAEPTDTSGSGFADHLTRSAQLRTLLEQTRQTRTSPDRAVTVTLAPGNAVTSIELGSQARHHDGSTLAALIMETVHRATEELRDTLSTGVAELTPNVDVADLLSGGLPDQPDIDTADGDQAAADAGQPIPDDWPEIGPDAAEIARYEAMVERLAGEAERIQTSYAQVRNHLSSLSQTTTSSDGELHVTVTYPGTLTGLRIADAAVRRGPKALGARVLALVQHASADLAARMAEQAQDVAGPQLDIRGLVAGCQPDRDADDEARSRR